MSARSLFAIATGIEQKARRTFQPVRRNSYRAGEREGRFWRPVDPKEKWAHIRAAEAYDRQRKEPGKRNGPLGHIAIELLRELYRGENGSGAYSGAEITPPIPPTKRVYFCNCGIDPAFVW